MNSSRKGKTAWVIALLAMMWAAPAFSADATDKLAASLRNRAGQPAALIELYDQGPTVRPVRQGGETIARYRARLVDHLRAQAQRSQAGLIASLEQAGLAYQSFWVLNAVRVEADSATLVRLAARADVKRIHADTPVRQSLPGPEPELRAPLAVEPGVNFIGAPQVWAAGFRGQGVVVAGQDTGVRWDHAALRPSYRGWDGVAASHAYHWHDAIHSGSNTCGVNTVIPCDDNNHGTHTVGTITGDDGGTNQIGVAPAAKWIACRNMNAGAGTPTTYTECFQWFMAPTDSSNQNPRPDLAPDVINNSWGCPASEGCDAAAIAAMETVVDNVRAAGIVVVVSAGNSGSACGTIDTPAAIYDASFTVGNMSVGTGGMSGSSSRGPSAFSSEIKPDVSAPGSSVRSATRTSTTSYASFSGTSMAGPHVAGAVALLISADPRLRGDTSRLEDILRRTAVPLTTVPTQTCGSIAPTTYPNYVVGYGRIDVHAAYQVVADTLFFDDFE